MSFQPMKSHRLSKPLSIPGLALAFLLLAFPLSAAPPSLPTGMTSASGASMIDDLLHSVAAIAESPDLDPSQKMAQVESIIRNSLDLDGMTTRVLQGLQADFSENEQQAFSAVFQEYLVTHFLQRAAGLKSDHIEVIGSENTDSGVVVKTRGGIRSPLFWTRSQTRPHQTRADYFLDLNSVPPRIQRILIDGIDVLQNFRSQFNGLLRRQSPEELIQLLERKTEDLQKKNPFAR